ncbi:EutP/PduV family microcompartment system protein [Rhodoferax sp.]|uniref:EutP/PduV family microcompartment system protein n=1 Tax=Rhodoferax sp. TaxID=50421 RepID=UPI00263004F0|nr:EutP/PduV family microcompartment system protein [Rhodoferax sp.]MDD2925727.1 EutP/PduV family microcompartment system protein [Rhodoferax sp.]
MSQAAKVGRFMLIGDIGAGKTTLFNHLFGRDEEARKTQVMEFEGHSGIDTPGEYFSHPRLYHTLITMAADVQRLVYVHPADVFDCRLPYGLLDVYVGKAIDAIVTKMDLPDADLPRVAALLRDAGVSGQIFPVSIHDPASLVRVRHHLLGLDQSVMEQA